ncbi:MAG: AAA family ATPase [Saprospiraceae bacterium]
MFIKKIELKKYKILEDISIDLEKEDNHRVFPIISINGGGKSSLLQLIFVFLHCAFEQNRHEYLKTLLNGFNYSENNSSVIKFELEHNGENIFLEFIQFKNSSQSFNFDAIINEKQINEKINTNDKFYNRLKLLYKLQEDVEESNLSPNLAYRELRKYTKTKTQDTILKQGNRSTILEFIASNIDNIESAIDNTDELNQLLLKANVEKNKLFTELESLELKYAFHFNNNKNILLFKTNTKIETLEELSNKIYLSTPITQVLHFIEDNKLNSLFKNEKYVYSSYENTVRECQKDLKGLFNYDFSTIELILEAFKKARDADFKKAIETGEYGNQIKSTRDELSSMFSGKSISVDSDFKGVSFKLKNSNKALTPKDLSHGELKKLSIYIWLKAIVSEDSLILMDEVDMGLHPIWQHELYSDLQKWSKGSQFLLATHSPQLISKSHYKNLVVLKPTKFGTTTEQFTEAPLESDLNTIVKTIMGGEYLPKELIVLRQKYRKLFEQDKLKTKEAKNIKQKILMYESENSSFFQDIKFQMQLR